MKTNRKLADFGELWPAEVKIVAGIDSGNITIIGKDVPAADAGKERQVRASFIRYLALGGCKKCKTHEKGLRVQGALIFGDGKGDETNGLDLEGCVLAHDLGLVNCRFPDMVLLRGCSGQSFFFGDSHLSNGLAADRLEAKGMIGLRRVTAKGEVRLPGAKLGGALDCGGAEFDNPSRNALMADGLETSGSVFLSGVTAKGVVQLLGAKLGGDLGCDGAEFDNPSGIALNADGLEAKGTFFLRSGAKIEGRITLYNAEVGGVDDDPACWPTGENSIGLDRFRYAVILGENAAIDAKTRLAWLKKARFLNDFSPQPYEQLAQVLRDMGHRNDARDVLIEKERLQRKDRRDRTPSVVYSCILWLRDQTVNLTVRYGHRPLLAFAWLAIFWAAGAIVFDNAAQNSAFKPNSSRVWQDDAWIGCAGPDQMNCYLGEDEGKSYPKFSALIYSADTLLPIVDLELQNVWIPDEAKAPWVRRYLWLQILAGWALSLLAVAGFSGLIKKSD